MAAKVSNFMNLKAANGRGKFERARKEIKGFQVDKAWISLDMNFT